MRYGVRTEGSLTLVEKVRAAFRSEPLTTEDLRLRFSVTSAQVDKAVDALLSDGFIERVGFGEYRKKRRAP